MFPDNEVIARIICEKSSGYEWDRLNEAGKERYLDIARCVKSEQIKTYARSRR